jgi:hypothetical protein
MKRLCVLLIGLGVILAAGCQHDVLAQSTDSLFLMQIQSIDSSESASLKQRAERNFAYIKAGPANPAKVSGEVLVGGLGAVVGGSICAGIGFGLGSEGDCNGFCCFDEGGIIGALVGYAVGSNLGSATGVYVVGNSGGDKGSYWASLGGSLLGTALGGVCAIAILRGSDDDAGALSLFVLTAAQVGGAAIGFNATRKRKVEVPSGALLNLDEDKLSLAFPQVNVSPDFFGKANFRIDLFQANF